MNFFSKASFSFVWLLLNVFFDAEFESENRFGKKITVFMQSSKNMFLIVWGKSDNSPLALIYLKYPKDFFLILTVIVSLLIIKNPHKKF